MKYSLLLLLPFIVGCTTIEINCNYLKYEDGHMIQVCVQEIEDGFPIYRRP